MPLLTANKLQMQPLSWPCLLEKKRLTWVSKSNDGSNAAPLAFVKTRKANSFPNKNCFAAKNISKN